MIPNGERPVVQADLDSSAGWAPFARVVEHVDDRTLELLSPAFRARRLEVKVDRDIGRPQPGPVDGGGHHSIEVDLCGLLRRCVRVAGELDKVVHEGGQLSHLLGDVGEQPATLVFGHARSARQHLDVRAQARQGRLQLVARVSDEFALLLPGHVQSAASIALRLEARRPSSSRRRTSIDAARSCVVATRSAARVEPRHRSQARTGDEEREQCSEADAQPADDQQRGTEVRDRVVDVTDVLSELDRSSVPAGGAGDAKVPAVHVGVPELERPGASGNRDVITTQGDRGGLVLRDLAPPVSEGDAQVIAARSASGDRSTAARSPGLWSLAIRMASARTDSST